MIIFNRRKNERSRKYCKFKTGSPPSVSLVALTKTYTVEKIIEAYNTGYKICGENKAQELTYSPACCGHPVILFQK